MAHDGPLVAAVLELFPLALGDDRGPEEVEDGDREDYVCDRPDKDEEELVDPLRHTLEVPVAVRGKVAHDVVDHQDDGKSHKPLDDHPQPLNRVVLLLRYLLLVLCLPRESLYLLSNDKAGNEEEYHGSAAREPNHKEEPIVADDMEISLSMKLDERRDDVRDLPDQVDDEEGLDREHPLIAPLRELLLLVHNEG